MAASIAYYALFSLFPLALGLIALSGFFLDPEEVQRRIMSSLGEVLPLSADDVSKTIQGVVAARDSIGIFSLVGLLWSATAIFGAIRRSINRAWNIEKGRPFWKQRLLDLAMLGVVGSLLFLSLGLTTFVRLISRVSLPQLGLEEVGQSLIWRFGTGLFPFFFTFGVFLVIYRFVPNTRVTLGDVWPGALFGAIGFDIAKNLFAWYVENFANYNLVYGSLTSIIVFLFWTYVSAIILLLGAELASEYSRMLHSHGHGGFSKSFVGD
ncbi:MAG: YihY/virulence factor BrkB family protein [Chloroflexi bacterium]|nr:YihY/virulence factor BrkB family protein [Chloroflexota bacterium]